jgi:hypothetical protein
LHPARRFPTAAAAYHLKKFKSKNPPTAWLPRRAIAAHRVMAYSTDMGFPMRLEAKRD